MSIIVALIIILFLAFLAESLTEYIFGALVEHTPALKPWRWSLMYIAIAVGIILAFVYRLDMVYLLFCYLASFLPEGTVMLIVITHGWVGMLLTGIVIGRGSNFVHDIWKRFFVKPQLPES